MEEENQLLKLSSDLHICTWGCVHTMIAAATIPIIINQQFFVFVYMYWMCIGVLPECVSMSESWILDSRHLWAAMWVLRIESRSSVKEQSVLLTWVIPPAPKWTNCKKVNSTLLVFLVYFLVFHRVWFWTIEVTQEVCSKLWLLKQHCLLATSWTPPMNLKRIWDTHVGVGFEPWTHDLTHARQTLLLSFTPNTWD